MRPDMDKKTRRKPLDIDTPESYTLPDAFKIMIAKRGIFDKLGMTRQAVGMIKTYFKNGQLSTDKMRELLQKAGEWEKIQEELYRKTH